MHSEFWPQSRALILVLWLILIATSSDVVSDNPTDDIVWIADAHVHHGLRLDGNDLAVDRVNYFPNGDIRLFGYLLPIKRGKTENLVSVIQSEMEELQSLAINDDRIRLVLNPSDIRNKPEENDWLLMPAIEYFHGIFSDNPTTVQEYADLGIRYITLVNNDADRLFTADHLTPFGRSIIEKMNETGILIDIAHLSEKQALEVIQHSNKPVISSHSSAAGASGSSASLSDDVLEALVRNRGYVFATFNRNDLFEETNSAGNGINQYIKHIKYLVEKLGHGRVGIGSDYQVSGRYVPTELNLANTFEEIQDGLIQVGYSPEEVEMICHGAFINAFGHAY